MEGGGGDDSFSAGAGDTVTDSEGTDVLILADGPPASVATSGADLPLTAARVRIGRREYHHRNLGKGLGGA